VVLTNYVLALTAGGQRLANWGGAAVPPSPATVVTIMRKLEIAARACRA